MMVENRQFTILAAVSNIIFQLTGLRMMTIDVTFDERFHFLVHLIVTEFYYKTLFGLSKLTNYNRSYQQMSRA